MTEIILNEHEKKVLKVLADDTDTWGEKCIGFDWIMDESKLSRKEVQIACKRLRTLNLVHFYRGLMTDDGEVAGSGYCVSAEGEALMYPCDKCSKARYYDWWENSKGEQVYGVSLTDSSCIHIQLCADHYKELKGEK